MSRNGFALLAVLWTLTVLAGSVALGTAGARVGQRASANRLALARGRWAAESCLAIAHARGVRGTLADTATIDLGRTVHCAWTVVRPDARLDVNHAPRAALVTLATGVGVSQELIEPFAGAVIDARRGAPFTDVAQLGDLPGADARVLALLSVDGSGRVDAGTADPTVLASLPGITPEAVATLVRRRAVGGPIRTFDELGGSLSPGGRATLHANYAELVTLLQFASTRLILKTEGWVSAHGRLPAVTIEAVIERLPDRFALLRRRQR